MVIPVIVTLYFAGISLVEKPSVVCLLLLVKNFHSKTKWYGYLSLLLLIFSSL